MENSSVHSMTKALSSNETTSVSQDESGWTLYFEDFLLDNNNNEEHSYCSSDLVSDAASLAGKKSTLIKRSSKRLSFKKRKTIGALVDDALEDTASSPVSSPKVRIFLLSFCFLGSNSHSLNILYCGKLMILFFSFCFCRFVIWMRWLWILVQIGTIIQKYLRYVCTTSIN